MDFPALFPTHGAPRALPLVGHALAMQSDPLRMITALAREHGGMAPMRLGPLSGYLISEPELVGQVLVTQESRYTRMTPVYEAMKDFLGDGILTTEGDDWRVHRRIVQPAFHKRQLASFTDQSRTSRPTPPRVGGASSTSAKR